MLANTDRQPSDDLAQQDDENSDPEPKLSTQAEMQEQLLELRRRLQRLEHSTTILKYNNPVHYTARGTSDRPPASGEESAPGSATLAPGTPGSASHAGRGSSFVFDPWEFFYEDIWWPCTYRFYHRFDPP